jgi:hypothetical protein
MVASALELVSHNIILHVLAEHIAHDILITHLTTTEQAISHGPSVPGQTKTGTNSRETL